MSCVVSGVSVLNTTGFTEVFMGLWMTAWLKSWVIAFPSLLVFAPLVRRFVDKLLVGKRHDNRLAQTVTCSLHCGDDK